MPRADVVALLESDTVSEAEVVGAVGFVALGATAIAGVKSDGNPNVQRNERWIGDKRKRVSQSANSPAALKALSGLHVGKTDIDAAEAAGGW